MTEEFETLKTITMTPLQIQRLLNRVENLPEGLQIDKTRVQMLETGKRRFSFILTKEAVEEWAALGTKPINLGLLVYHHSGTIAPYVNRVLVALPGERGNIRLEMRDNQWNVLWTGKATLEQGELNFEMPISRQRVDVVGMMSGRLNSKGQLVLREARLPRPLKKQKPVFESEA